MTELEAIRARHSVRRYRSDPVPDDIRAMLQAHTERINAASGLDFQIIYDKPEVFEGKIKGSANCVAFIGKKSPDLLEKIGYWGADIMLRIQELGLNSVWVAMSFNKKPAAANVKPADGEQIINVLAFGYGEDEGKPHKSKPIDKLCEVKGEMPDWFAKGMEAAALAPTAINQQRFVITLDGEKIEAKAKVGPYAKVDLGIVKYFFEAASGRKFSG